MALNVMVVEETLLETTDTILLPRATPLDEITDTVPVDWSPKLSEMTYGNVSELVYPTGGV